MVVFIFWLNESTAKVSEEVNRKYSDGTTFSAFRPWAPQCTASRRDRQTDRHHHAKSRSLQRHSDSAQYDRLKSGKKMSGATYPSPCILLYGALQRWMPVIITPYWINFIQFQYGVVEDRDCNNRQYQCGDGLKHWHYIICRQMRWFTAV